jgi:YfiR/HmsC-like
MRTAVHLVLAMVMLALASGMVRVPAAEPGRAPGQDPVEEYRLKAAFVASFAGFVEWPPDILKNPHDPIVICILGENPFGSALDRAAGGKSVQDHQLAVHAIADVRQAAGCQILFVSASESKHFRSILKDPQLSGILTVGDTHDFTSQGGVINLQLESDRIRILINTNAVEQGRLRISSKLLSLARIVKN